MPIKVLLKYVNIADLTLTIGIVVLLWRKGLARLFPAFTSLLCARALHECFVIALLFFRKELGIPLDVAYPLFFDVSWCWMGVNAMLLVATIYGVYAAAMKPLEGLASIGKMIFRWVGGISIIVSLGYAVGAHLANSDLAMAVGSRLLQGISVLTLCVLLFVCLAVRPLGLTFRSHIFGISLGLGVTATTTLVQAVWLQTSVSGGHNMYSPGYLVSGVASCVALMIWGTYFALPEPARRMILLPTTSPFFWWNHISEVLGDEPGNVAIAGFTPEMLAPAEIAALTAASSPQAEPGGSRPAFHAALAGVFATER